MTAPTPTRRPSPTPPPLSRAVVGVAAMPARPDRRRLRSRLKSLAYAALAGLPDGFARPLAVAARDGRYRVDVAVTPGAGPAGTATPIGMAGRYFSDVEAALVNALGPDGCLSGKQLAAKLGREYDTR